MYSLTGHGVFGCLAVGTKSGYGLGTSAPLDSSSVLARFDVDSPSWVFWLFWGSSVALRFLSCRGAGDGCEDVESSVS